MRLFQELCHKRNCVNPRRRGFRFCMRKDCGNEEKKIIDTEYMVTHIKSGESDGPFATYEEAKAHYDSQDIEWQLAHYIEEVRG